MKRFFLLFSLSAATLLPATLWAQAQFVEHVGKIGDRIMIPYDKYKLPNGLTLIIHEDHSDPLVHVDVTYHVGSAREQIGKSGFAHFFEHMMFQGSDHVADEQHFKIITEAGGTLNGTTNRDRTNYFETVPNNQLEKMLWLEADRMGFLIDAVTQQKFEVQRATVKNERGQNYDNRPYGLVGEVAAKAMYPYGHPYSWLTIGYIEDLNRVGVEDLKNFFLRWYGPNNAVLTIGGDVKTADVIKLVEKYFGSIPKGPDVQPVRLPAPVISQDRYVSMTDNYAKVPMLRIVYPSTPQFTKDEPALDCLAEILGKGNNSILYKNLVKAQKAVNANSYNNTSELAGEFTISVTPFPGQKLADLEKIVRASFDEFEQRGATDDEILKFKNQQESETIYGLESVSQKVSKLAAYQTYTGNANYIEEEIKRYASVTKEDVMRVYNQYIKGKHAVIVSVLTKGQEDNKAAADNYTVDTTGYKAPDYGYAALKYTKAKDTFDRNKIPASGPSPVVTAPPIWMQKVMDRNVIAGTMATEVPVVNITIEFKGGQLLDALKPAKAGLTNLFATMMNEDTKKYSAEAFTTELQKLGSTINVYARTEAVGVNVHCLQKNLDATLALLEERLLNTVFKEETFKSRKNRMIQNIKNANTQPSYVASEVFNKINYGKDNVLGWSMNGNEATVANIQLSDIEDYYKNYCSFKDGHIVVVGNISSKDIINKLSFLQKMPYNLTPVYKWVDIPKVEKTKIYFVNVPNAAQTEFRIGYVTNIKYDVSGEFYKSLVMNYPFGGSFNSRLNLLLREDKGWTYGARSVFSGDKISGDFQFSAGIKAQATDSALREILRLTKEYKDGGMNAEELAFTQKSIGQGEARKYETGAQKAQYISRIVDYNLSTNYPVTQNEVLQTLTVGDMKKLALKNIPSPDRVNILLVGDKAKLWDRLKSFGYELVELDKEGNLMK